MTSPMRGRGRLALLGLALITVLSVACHTDPQKRKAQLVAAGDKYLAAGKIGNAIIEYKNALRIEPRSAELEYKLGQALFRNRQYQDAFVAYTKSNEFSPDYAPAQLALGQFDLLSRKFDDAMKKAQAILAKDPGNKEAQILLADAYAGQKNLPEGTQALEKLVRQYGDYVPGYLNLGLFEMAQGKINEAKAQFEKAVTVDPKSVEARKALAGFYTLAKDFPKAEQQYRAAVDANPDSVDAHQALASFYMGQRRFSDAEPVYKAISKLQKNSPESRFTLANFYLSQGKVEDARKTDAEIAKDTPNFMPARLQLADLALREQKYDVADQVLSQILKDRPKEAQALTLAAQVSIARKDPQKAIQQLETAQKSEPNMPAIHYWKGVAYEAQGNLELAQHSFERAIGIYERYTDAHMALAKLMLDRGVPDSALKYAQRASEQDPNRAEAHLLAGMAYYNLQKLPDAEKEFQQFAEMEPNSPQGPLRLGAVHLMQRRYDVAEKDFEKALSINPKQTDALNGLATIYRAKSQNDKAIARIRQQIALAETADIDNLLGKTYMDLGQSGPAEQILNRALQLDPQNYNAHALLGTLYAQEKSLDKAVAEYEAATRVNPRQIGAWTVLGMLETRRGDVAKATQAYQKALQIDPNAGLAANNLAWLYCNQGGDLDAALDLARRARQTLPKSPAVSDTLGWIYYKRDLYGSAIPLLQEATRGEPKNGEYRFHLAASLLAAGKKEQARSEIKAALKLDEGLRKRPDVQRVLDQLPST